MGPNFRQKFRLPVCVSLFLKVCVSLVNSSETLVQAVLGKVDMLKI